MPKRSNDFQRLIYLVRVNLSAGAEVKESHLMRDRLTKRHREVDVVIRGSVGSQPVVVSIECRDHKRVADVSWVDAMKSKHERLDTNVLILASSKGFTKEAEDVAKKYGIDTYSLETQDSPHIADKLGPNGTLWHKSFTISPDRVSVRVSATNDHPSETVRTAPDNLVYSQDGVELLQLKELVTQLLRTNYMRDYLFANGAEEHKRFELVWEPPSDEHGRPLYMKKLEPEMLRPIEAIRIAGPCDLKIGKFRFQYGRIGTVQVAWSKATIAGRDAMVVATTDDSGASKLTVNVKGSPQNASAPLPQLNLQAARAHAITHESKR